MSGDERSAAGVTPTPLIPPHKGEGEATKWCHDAIPWYLLAPTVALLGVLLVLPIGIMFLYTFYEFVTAGVEKATYIGANWREFFSGSYYPNKVKLTDKIAALPAFDPTGTMKSLTFADPNYWAANFDEWQKQWDRISKGA